MKKYLKLIKGEESYDIWKDSDEAGYPHVAMYNENIIFEKRTEKPSLFPIYLTSNVVSFTEDEVGMVATYTFNTEKINNEKYLSDYIFDFYISKLEPLYSDGELLYYEIPEKVTEQYPVYFNGCKIVCVGNSPMSNNVGRTEIMFDIEENLPPLDGYEFLYPFDTARVFWNENGIITLTVYVKKKGPSFPITLNKGENGQIGIDIYNYLCNDVLLGDWSDTEVIDELYVSNGYRSFKITIVYRISNDTVSFYTNETYTTGTLRDNGRISLKENSGGAD